MSNTENLSIRISPEILKALNLIAEKKGVSLSDTTRSALELFVAEGDKTEQTTPTIGPNIDMTMILSKLTELEEGIDSLEDRFNSVTELAPMMEKAVGGMNRIETAMSRMRVEKVEPRVTVAAARKPKPFHERVADYLKEAHEIVEGFRGLLYATLIMTFIGFYLGTEFIAERVVKQTKQVMSEQIGIAVQESWERTAAMQRNVEARKREEAERQGTAKPDPKRVR